MLLLTRISIFSFCVGTRSTFLTIEFHFFNNDMPSKDFDSLMTVLNNVLS